MSDAALEQAVTYEQSIAEQAAEIRGDATELTPELFLKLWPLLCKPIPAAYIQTIGKTEGKPYPSTGVRSVQVQIDRMNNVLTPLWWWDDVNYEDGGKLCTVGVYVGVRNGLPGEPSRPLVVRHSRGGVARGSSTGNIYKGSYTNAAKVAFARLGPGHEVYVGATDLDPDVSEDLAKQAPAEQAPETVPANIAAKLVEKAWAVPAAKDQLQLAASHVAGSDVGDCATKAKAKKAVSKLTFEQAERLTNWIEEKASGE